MEFNKTKKLYKLLEIALDDLEKMWRNPKYIIDMAYWHEPGEDQCHICLAGAVIANRMDSKPDRAFHLNGLDDNIRKRLYAIDELREGEIIWAYEFLKYGTMSGKRIADEEKLKIWKVEQNFADAEDFEDFEDFEASLEYYRDMQKVLKEANI